MKIRSKMFALLAMSMALFAIEVVGGTTNDAKVSSASVGGWTYTNGSQIVHATPDGRLYFEGSTTGTVSVSGTTNLFHQFFSAVFTNAATNIVAEVFQYQYGGTPMKFMSTSDVDLGTASYRGFTTNELVNTTFSSGTNGENYVNWWVNQPAFGTVNRFYGVFVQ